MSEPAHDSRLRPPFGGDTRAHDGVLVQLDSGRVLHRHGARSEDCLRQVAAECDRTGERICVISSPSTIWRDLQGSRLRSVREPIHFGEIGQDVVKLPEAQMLGQIRRVDLLAR